MDTTGEIVVEELKAQARKEGYYVWAISRTEVSLYLMYLAGIALGFMLARRTE